LDLCGQEECYKFGLLQVRKTHLSRQRARRVVAPHHSGHRFGRAKQPERHDYGGFSVFARLPNDRSPGFRIAWPPPPLTQFWFEKTGFLELSPKVAASLRLFRLEFSRFSQIKW